MLLQEYTYLRFISTYLHMYIYEVSDVVHFLSKTFCFVSHVIESQRLQTNTILHELHNRVQMYADCHQEHCGFGYTVQNIVAK